MEETQSPLTPEEPAKRVTALIVSHNNATGLTRLIRSLENSPDREETEILVIDLGSTDGSGQIDNQFPGVTVLRLAKHFGATKALNIATRTASADYIFYLDPAVELPPDAVSTLATLLDSDHDAVAVCPRLASATDGAPVAQAFRIPDAPALAAACESATGLLSAVAIPPAGDAVTVEYASRSAILTRKQFVQGMNFFDGRYGQHWADLEFALQIRKAQKKILVVPTVMAVWHEPDVKLDRTNTMSADRWIGAAAFLEKHFGSGAAFQFRLGAVIKAIFGFRFGLVLPLISGQKVDGSQSEF